MSKKFINKPAPVERLRTIRARNSRGETDAFQQCQRWTFGGWVSFPALEDGVEVVEVVEQTTTRWAMADNEGIAFYPCEADSPEECQALDDWCEKCRMELGIEHPLTKVAMKTASGQFPHKSEIEVMRLRYGAWSRRGFAYDPVELQESMRKPFPVS